LDIYIGYDVAERVAYHALSQSLIDLASIPIRITPIALSTLGALHGRPRLSQQSTDFSFTRFLTPFLSGYAGWSLFMDCDMLARADIAELFALADDRFAVMVAQHDYTPRDSEKFLGNLQLPYPKKNWSSVMLFNNARCRALTPDYVDTATGLDLHQFRWLAGDEEIGSLPIEWNWLVGEYASNPAAKIVHFTRGGPWFIDYWNCDYADEWSAVRARAIGAAGSDARD
jgi:lipopolysaccharide biosynthesis glycosyltransferase